jgi:hypothetical protein
MDTSLEKFVCGPLRFGRANGPFRDMAEPFFIAAYLFTLPEKRRQGKWVTCPQSLTRVVSPFAIIRYVHEIF